MRNIIIVIVVLVLAALGYYFYTQKWAPSQETTENQEEITVTPTSPTATSTDDGMTQLGTSVQGRPITAYHYGGGSSEILFVGGIHGGYEWNTSLVAYELMDYLKQNESAIPSNLKVTVVPVLNPDGLAKVASTTGKFTAADVAKSQEQQITGRFNGNNVDLNRNFDCDWNAVGTWQTRKVSGGTAAFSEPESKAIRDYILTSKPAAVIVWYSSAGGVFASSCHNGVSDATRTLMNTYAKASGYPAYDNFDFYEITGDMVNWLAKSNIPAISVLLTNHTDTEWSKNKAGVDAVLKQYASEEEN